MLGLGAFLQMIGYRRRLQVNNEQKTIILVSTNTYWTITYPAPAESPAKQYSNNASKTAAPINSKVQRRFENRKSGNDCHVIMRNKQTPYTPKREL